MRSRSLPFVVALSLAGWALAGSTLAAATEASGVAGQVVARQPGAVGCVRAPCFRPLAGVLVTVTGERTIHVRADRAGRFRVVLEPGLWTAHAPHLMSLTGGGVSFRVVPGRFRKVVLVVGATAGDRGGPAGRV